MKFSLDNGSGGFQVLSYAPGLVVVGGLERRRAEAVSVRHELRRSALISSERIIDDWPVAAVDALRPGHFDVVQQLQPEVVLLGTGDTLRFPDVGVRELFARRNMGLEVMDTPAACRTYNILMMEDRRVVAALIL